MRAIPIPQVVLGGPLSALPQVRDQRASSSSGFILSVSLLEERNIELADRLQPVLILLHTPDAGIEGTARIAREACRPSSPTLEERRHLFVSEHQPKAPELVIHERIHRVEDDRSHGGGGE